MPLKILTTGGTIDKVYYDALSDYRIGEPAATELLSQAGVSLEYSIQSLLKKDSLEMDQQDRILIRDYIQSDGCRRFVITHGTDTMIETARTLKTLSDRTIVLTGAMQPARFRDSDAAFNLGGAVALAQTLPPGVYIFMNGRVFNPEQTVKNRAAGQFEEQP